MEPESAPVSLGEDMFTSGGEMGVLMRSLDWSATAAGPVERWPQSLRTAVSICLASRFPIIIFWGQHLVQFYNDAYRPILGATKHPAALGQEARECWPEIWDVIGPMLNSVLATGEATWSDDQLLLLDRNGFAEECYFTFSYSPMRDESGGVGGVFCAVTETTGRVLAERRQHLLRELAARAGDAYTEGDALRAIGEMLENAVAMTPDLPGDLPLARLYLLDADGATAQLAIQVGPDVPQYSWPKQVRLAAREPESEQETGRRTSEVAREGAVETQDAEMERRVTETLSRVVTTGQTETMTLREVAFQVEADATATEQHAQNEGAPTQTVTAAMMLPVARPGQAQPYGLLVVGINPYVALDISYSGFLTLLAGQVAGALANARAHDEERRRAEALAELDRAKTAFFSNVSHEFRTPLTLLLGPVEDALAAGDEPLPERQRERIEIVHRNGLRLLRLVNTLLDFSRIEAGRIEASYEATDLAVYTAELASVFRSAIERAGLRLRVDCPLLPEPVYVDRDMWEKIVFNLLSNAFKFTFAGEIAVRLYLTPVPSSASGGEREGSLTADSTPAGRGGSVVLEVRDTGVGIPAEELDRVFERFHRVRDAQARTYEGTGIGLSLVRELALLHGGSVAVESVVGEGTAFRVTIPLGAREAQAAGSATARAASSAVPGAAFVEEALRWLPEDTFPSASVPPSLSSTLRSGGSLVASGRREAETAGGAPTEMRNDGKAGGERVPAARVLVVDDNADMRAYLMRLLEEQGWEVMAAANGAAALALAQRQAFDLVLSDIMMPELDGFALVRALRGNPATEMVPVILLSARAGEEAAGEGLDAGADDYVVKPFSARELVARVRSNLELTRMRRSVAEHAGQLDAIIEAVADGIFVYDAEGRILRTNAAARELYGFGADPTYATEPLEARVNRVETRDEHGQSLTEEQWPQRRVLSGESLKGEGTTDYWLRVLDGREVRVNVSGAPMRDRDGHVLGGVLILRDVTERRRLEQRTYEALNALLDLSEELVRVPAASAVERPADTLPGIATRLVSLIQRVFGCEVAVMATLDAATGRMRPLASVGLNAEVDAQWWHDVAVTPLHEYIAPTILARIYARQPVEIDLDTEPLLNGANYSVHRILMVPLVLGETIVGLMSVEHQPAPRFYTDDDMALMMAMGRLSALAIERERLLREREEARANELALLEANRRMDEFLGIASHELKTPLTTIKANVQLLARQMVGDTARRKAGGSSGAADGVAAGRVRIQRTMLERTDRQVDRLTRLVNDLVDVSRIREGKLELRPERFDLAQVIAEAVTEQRQAMPEREISLAAPEGPVMVTADPDRIGQVVTNYLTNALKYSTDEKPVRVALRVEGNVARLEVRDEGPGLPPEERERVWERFHRVAGIREQSGSGVGLGLGLHISKTIVERHDGQVGLESALGKGSTFWFTLPLDSSDVAGAEDA